MGQWGHGVSEVQCMEVCRGGRQAAGARGGMFEKACVQACVCLGGRQVVAWGAWQAAKEVGIQASCP